MDGQRLYVLLALFDRRDGTPLADLVQAAREGWERSHPDMAEDNAWAQFDRLWDSYTSRERSDLDWRRCEGVLHATSGRCLNDATVELASGHWVCADHARRAAMSEEQK